MKPGIYFKHKNRLDRGRMWYSIGIQTIVTAVLVTIFNSEVLWYYKVLSAIVTIVIIYLLGWVDDRLKLLDKEQKGTTERNAILMRMSKDIESIKLTVNNNICK
jgi:UDP-N-acetylmuramyl pentapeptide phosphotransferase/UDP-N-acetylglucosamine-1-phosphate transferase